MDEICTAAYGSRPASQLKDAVVELPHLYPGYRFALMRRIHTETSWTGRIHRDARVIVVSEDVYVLVAKSIFEDGATDFCWERSQRTLQAATFHAAISLAKEELLVN